MRIGIALLVIWLVVGAFAAFQRGYFGSSDVNCATLGTVALTTIAGPLNYVGVNPRIDCQLPQPQIPQPS